MKNKIEAISKMPNIPVPFDMKDWKQTTLDYDALVFNLNAKGDFLPLIWIDRSHKNVKRDTFGLPSYVMSSKAKSDGMQESINCAAAVLSSTLCGIDKSIHKGYDWVDMLENFYNTENGEMLFLDRADTKTGNSFWYEIYPHILLYSIVDCYKEKNNLLSIMEKTADRWLEVCNILGGPNIDFEYTAFDFIKMQPVKNGKWVEPDAAAGIAWIMFMAFEKFQKPEYLEAAKWCLDYLNKKDNNPYYELLMPYGAYVAARFNAQYDAGLNVNKFLKWCFDGDSYSRPGWGVIDQRWGDFDCHGLCGSKTDYGQRWDMMNTNSDSEYKEDSSGYAFAGNTFSMASGLIPLVRYDSSYAREIGKWILNAANNSRLFYPDYHPPVRQSCAFWHDDEKHAIAYEGLRKKWDGQVPYATGDGIRYSWGSLDLGLYGSSHVGLFGGIISKTNIPEILKIDCLKTDFFRQDALPTFLFYNPHSSEQSVIFEVGSTNSDIYDAITHEFILKNCSGECELKIPRNDAYLIVTVPANSEIIQSGNVLKAGNTIIDYNYSRRHTV